MILGSYRVEARWGHLAFAALLFGISAAYFIDAVSVSTSLDNLLLLAPATALIGILFIIVVVQDVRIVQCPEGRRNARSGVSRPAFDWRGLQVPAVMALVGLYVATMDLIGFDLATFLFVMLAQLVQGERRLPYLIGLSAVFSTIVIWGAKTLLTFPMPTVLL